MTLTLQEQLDALAISGGVLELPAGVYDNGGVPLKFDNLDPNALVIVRGQHRKTIIPPLTPKRPAERIYNVFFEDLLVDGALAPISPDLNYAYFAIDWRNVTWGGTKRIGIVYRDGLASAEYGLGLYYDSYQNNFAQSRFLGRKVAVEIYGGANQNYFWSDTYSGGEGADGKAISITSSNGNQFFGGSMEIPVSPSKGLIYNGVEIFPGSQPGEGNWLYGVRRESPTWGPAWFR